MKKHMLLLMALSMAMLVNAQYVNPLERWATHNVDVLNTFVTGDASSARGKLYQFGRNIPLSTVNGEEVPITDGRKATSLTDPVVWTENLLITSSANPDNWYEGGSAADTWESIVEQTMVAAGVPATYKGTNGGCPCPPGWKLPTSNEFNAIMSKAKAILFDPDNPATAIIDDINEADIDLDGRGNLHTYKADYRVVSVVEAFGLRFKGTPHATAFHYVYADQGVVISAKPAGNATVNEIALEWTAADWNDAMVRHFPRSGFRGWSSKHLYNGHPDNTNDSRGFYWTNTAADDKNSWGVGFYLRGSDPKVRTATHGAMTRRHAFNIRCVKDPTLTSDRLTENSFSDLSVWSNHGDVYVSSSDMNGSFVFFYNLLGVVVHKEKAVGNRVVTSLPPGFYVIGMGKHQRSVIVK